jgi:hypothetical protein
MSHAIPKVPRTNNDVEIQKWRNEVAIVIKEHLFNLPAYANNTLALAGGLVSGDFYRTGGDPDTVCVVSP